jgi:hypothetical protein
MKRLIAVICIVLMVFTSSCAMLGQGVDYATDVMNLKVESVLIKNQYEKMYMLVDGKMDNFTDDEKSQLNDIHFAFSEAAIRIEMMMDDPKNAITPTELKGMYELVYIGYTTAREIITSHSDIFTSYQWSQMINFDKKAKEYDLQVRAILDNPDTNDINMTLGLIITLGGAAYKYLLPVLVSII